MGSPTSEPVLPDSWPDGVGALIVPGLPGRGSDPEAAENALYPGSTIDVMKLLREQGVVVDYAPVDKPRAEIELKAAELWVPLIIFAKDVLIDGGAHALVEVIWDRLHGRRTHAILHLQVGRRDAQRQRRLVRVARESRRRHRRVRRLVGARRQVSDWIIEHGLTAAAQAERTLANAMELEGGEWPRAEETARTALAEFRSAMNWLEDTEHFDEAHRKLDEAGSYVRRTFGCQLFQDGTRYEQRCPVALAHNRIGLSPGMIIRASECSICGQDPVTCPHITGRTYDGEFCARRITEADVLEVSLVSRPSQPDARIHAISIDNDELRERLPPEWEPGIPVNCDRCLLPCDGVHDPLLAEPPSLVGH